MKQFLSQGLAMTMIFVGIILSTFHYKDIVQKKIMLSRGISSALLTMLFFGIWGTFIKIPVQHIGWFWPNVIMFVFFPPSVYLLMKLKKAKIQNPLKNNFLFPLIIGALAARLGELSYNAAVGNGIIAIVAPIATSYPTLFALLSFFAFKDKITKQQIAGILTTLVGIVLLSFLSV